MNLSPQLLIADWFLLLLSQLVKVEGRKTTLQRKNTQTICLWEIDITERNTLLSVTAVLFFDKDYYIQSNQNWPASLFYL